MYKHEYGYFQGMAGHHFNFYQLPEDLALREEFRELSSDAKLLYSVMLKRVGLSFRNGWIDDKGRTYIIYTLEEVMKVFHCANQKATKLFNELELYGLIEKTRQGQGKPALIYVKDIASPVDCVDNPNQTNEDSHVKTHENHDSGTMIIRNQDSWKSGASNKDKSYITGHRRAHAAEAAGLTEVPVIVRDMDDDAATVLMVDSNLQRENILPSERAFAYKMKLEAMKRQGERTDLQGEETSTQLVSKLRSNERLGEQNNQSRETVRRYIRLTNLIPELLDMVDQKQISFNPAVELSYLTPEEQRQVIEAMDFTQAAPSLSQAQRLKKLSQEGGCTLEAMQDILGEVKKGDLERVAFKSEQLRKYFPKSYSPKQMSDTIIKLLEQWQKKRQRDMER